MSKRYIPEGAFLVCNKGQKMTQLKVTHNNNVNLYKVPYANENDKIPEENIPNFGECLTCGACKVQPLIWTPVKENVKVGGGRLIHEDSKLKCYYGDISVFLDRNEAQNALNNNKFNEEEKIKKRLASAALKGIAIGVGILAVGALLALTAPWSVPIIAGAGNFLAGAITAAGFGGMIGAASGTFLIESAVLTAATAIGFWATAIQLGEVTKNIMEGKMTLKEGIVVFLEDAITSLAAAGTVKLGGKLLGNIIKSNNTKTACEGTKCFVSGTEIETENGNKKIEEIEIGEKVYSYDEAKKEKVLKKVKKIHQNTTDILVKIKTKLDTIVTTPEHPFYVKGKYILAGFLSAGMSLTSFAGEEVSIQEVKVIRSMYPKTVYNLSIEDTENYYVGQGKILSHNIGDTCCGIGDLSDDIAKSTDDVDDILKNKLKSLDEIDDPNLDVRKIREYLINNSAKIDKKGNRIPYLNTDADKVSFAVGKVTKENGKIEYLLSTSDKSWHGYAPKEIIDIDGIKYRVIIEDSKAIESYSEITRSGNNVTNYRHAEKKIESYIQDNYKTGVNKIEISVINNSKANPGMCNMCQNSSKDFIDLNKTREIIFYHGTTGISK